MLPKRLHPDDFWAAVSLSSVSAFSPRPRSARLSKQLELRNRDGLHPDAAGDEGTDLSSFCFPLMLRVSWVLKLRKRAGPHPFAGSTGAYGSVRFMVRDKARLANCLREHVAVRSSWLSVIQRMLCLILI
mmetsp:Transcript_1854/g.3822  ORF Transcript_1854/g.3822 Transcript_1854/m.3822 type:complete len:130 (+) Transcript_1854:1245-1634(+)